MKKKINIIITGGHHNSALVICDWLKKNDGGKFNIIWVGRRYLNIIKGLYTPEYEEVIRRNISFYHFISGKLFRTSSLLYFHKVIYNLFLVPIGLIYALILIIIIRPKLIISFGGYLALPIVVVGTLFKIRSVTHEQTTVLGLANRIIAKFVKNVYVSWPVNTYKVSKEIKNKMVFTGLPLRDEIYRRRHKNKYAFKNNKPVLYVTGGKNGSQFLNNLVVDNLHKLLSNYNVILSTGKKNYSYILREIDRIGFKDKLGLIIEGYIGEYDIGCVLNNTDLIISRSGAHITYEILVLNIPAIMIPLMNSSMGEQMNNARIASKYSKLIKVINPNIAGSCINMIDIINHHYKFVSSINDNTNVKIFINGKEKLGKEIINQIY